MTPAEALDYLHKNADSRNAIFNAARLKTALFTLGAENAELECFIRAVRCEVMRAQKLFPGRRLMGLAFNEEVGELNKALLDEPWKQVYKEAVQAATMAARVALEGDESVYQWRAGKGLDNPTRVE